MKARKQRQVCDVTYFEDKKKNYVKATTTFTPNQRRCVQFVKLGKGAWQ